MEEHGEPGQRTGFRLSVDRLALFSDAVFAIAITLLAIDLRLDAGPNASDDAIWQSLLAMQPRLWGFVLGFAVTALFWVGHYRTFSCIERVNGVLIGLDLAFLLTVVFHPFATAALGDYADSQVTSLLYGGTALTMGVLSTLLWVYPYRAGLMYAWVTPGIARAVTLRAAVVPILFLASLPLIVLAGPTIAQLLWFLTWPIQLLVGRLRRQQPTATLASPVA